jgi:exodeoxyribonuclease V beta subunit
MQFQNFDVLNHKLEPGLTLVEASAGTGKTYSITWLVVRLLLANIDISEILLTTFTVAATEELKQRIRSHLSHVLSIWFEKEKWTPEIQVLYQQLYVQANAPHSLSEPALQADFWVQGEQKLRRGLGRIEEATIATIHGFCTNMLKDYTLEAGVELGKIESNLSPLFDEIIDDYRSYLLTSASLNSLRLFNQFKKELSVDAKELKGLIAFLQKGGWHAIWMDDYPTDVLAAPIDTSLLNHPQKLVELWDQVAASLFEYLSQKLIPLLEQHEERQQFKTMVDRMGVEAEWRKEYEASTRESAWKALDEISKAVVLEQKVNLVIAHYESLKKISQLEISNGLSKIHKKKNQAFFEFTHPIAEGLNQLVHFVESHQKTMRVYFRNIFVSYAQNELQQRKKQKNIMGMDDLILMTHEAIFKGDGLFKEVLQNRFKAGLIDEFQDTDPLQWGIFKSIFEQNHHILYLIGDPKQSIYRFRGADLNAYLAVKKQIKADRCFTMSRNFRSDPNILSAFNLLFDRKQAHCPPGTSSQGLGFFLDPYVPYIHVDAGKKNRYAGHAVKFVHFAQNEAFKSETMPAFIAGEVRKFLDAGHQIGEGDQKRTVRISDIGILSRNNKNANLIAQELYKRGIPSTVKSTESVFKTPTAKAFENLLRGMLMPADEGAFKAALSIPFFNYTADQIKKAAEAQKHIFIELHQIWMSQGVAAAIHALLYHTQLQIIPKILRQYQGAQQLTHLMHLAERLQAKAMEDQMSPELTLNWLRERRLEDIEEADTLDQVRPHLDEAAVEVVTIHKSKGLEYPILFCPDLWTSKPTQKPTIRVLDPEQEGVGKILDIRLEDDSSIIPMKSEAQARLDIADHKEARRLLYVALTRAIHHCCLYLHFSKKDHPLYDLIRGDEEKRSSSHEINTHLKDILEAWDQTPSISVEYHHHLGIPDTEMLKKGSLGERALAVSNPLICSMNITAIKM